MEWQWLEPCKREANERDQKQRRWRNVFRGKSEGVRQEGSSGARWLGVATLHGNIHTTSSVRFDEFVAEEDRVCALHCFFFILTDTGQWAVSSKSQHPVTEDIWRQIFALNCQCDPSVNNRFLFHFSFHSFLWVWSGTLYFIHTLLSDIQWGVC